ncbi:MAG: patatin-like phospholipase family protein [Rhodanobacter sp.]
MEATDKRFSHSHRPFTLVLAGGGARGFAHLGVLRALEAAGYQPAALVGVSMGAVVSAGYCLRPDWYPALLAMDTGAFPAPMPTDEQQRGSRGQRWRALWLGFRMVYRALTGWGVGVAARPAGIRALHTLTRGLALEDARPPLAVCATDLRGGRRHVLRTGDASEALYASVALAGILPPLERDGLLLADGAYADIAPVDVARAFGHPVVIAVNPGQEPAAADIRNGMQALWRAMEICNLIHADARFRQADLVLDPVFRRSVDMLDFAARRECVAAGIRAVRAQRRNIAALLEPDAVSLQHPASLASIDTEVPD